MQIFSGGYYGYKRIKPVFIGFRLCADGFECRLSAPIFLFWSPTKTEEASYYHNSYKILKTCVPPLSYRGSRRKCKKNKFSGTY